MFASFFNPEGKFFQIGSKAADLLLAGVLWLICCVPLVSIGPACTALYDVVVRNIRNDRGSEICCDFFRVFRRDFRQSMGLMLLLTALAAAALLGEQFMRQSGTTAVWLLRAVVVVVMMIGPYGFALISRFDNSFGRMLFLTLYLTFRHFLISLTMALLLALGGLLVYLHLPLAILMPGVVSLLLSLLLERVLQLHAPEAAIVPQEEESANE